MIDSDIVLLSGDKPFSIDVLLIDGLAMMSYAAAIEPFRAANILSGRELYRWRHLSVDGGPAQASNGVSLTVDAAYGGAAPDLLIVVAGGDPARFADAHVFAWLRRIARHGTIIAGVSGAPWLLARAGLLDDRRATIHWEHQPGFREAFPRVALEPTLYVIDGPCVTCAGGTAGLDMGVALIARAHGRVLAARVADWFISVSIRDAADSQRLRPGERYGVSSPPLLAALAYMEARIEEPVDRTVVAAHVGLSVRQLERLFAARLSTTPGRAYLAMRLDHARDLLRATGMPIGEVASACGFASVAHFSRAFSARHNRSPQQLRREHLAAT